MIRVEVLLPSLAGPSPFRLNISRLDYGDVLHTGTVTGSFILGTSKLDGPDQLGGVADPLAWVDITGPATEVHIKRGAKIDGVATKTDVGTCTVRAYNALKNLRIPTGTPLRVIDGNAIVYQGTTYYPGAEFVKQRDTSTLDGWEYRYTLTAVDKVRELQLVEPPMPLAGYYINNVRVPQRPQREDWFGWGEAQSRFAAILDPLGISWRKDDAEGPFHHFDYADLAEPRSAAELLDLSANTIGAIWWVGRDGVVQIRELDPTDYRPQINFRAASLGQSFTAVAAEQDPDSIVTGLDFDFIYSTQSGEEKTVTVRWDDPTATATWGTHRARVSLSAYEPHTYSNNGGEPVRNDLSPEALKAKLSGWLDMWLTTWRADPMTISELTVLDIPNLEIGDLVSIDGMGPDLYLATVIGLEHEARPTRTTTTITLKGRN